MKSSERCHPSVTGASPSSQNYVYRATGNGAFTMIAVLQPSTSYADRTVSSGRTYRYIVTAVAVANGVGEESPMANPVSIRTT